MKLLLIILVYMLNTVTANEVGQPFLKLGNPTDIKHGSMSADGKYLLTSSEELICNLTMWDLEKKQIINQFKSPIDSLSTFALSKDGTFTIFGSDNGEMLLFNNKTWKTIQTFNEDNKSIKALLFVSNDKYIISSTSDKTLKKWDINGSKLVQSIKTKETYVSLFLKDEKHLYASYRVEHSALIDIDTLKIVKSFDKKIVGATKLEGEYTIFINSGGGEFNDELAILNTDTNKSINLGINSIFIQQNPFVYMTTDYKYLIYKNGIERLVMLDINKWVEEVKSKAYTKRVYSIASTRDNHYLAVAGEDGDIYVWDIQTGARIHTLHGTYGNIRLLFTTHDNTHLLSANGDKNIMYWDIHSGKLLKEYKKEISIENLVEITKDDKYLVLTANNTIKLLDIKTGKLIDNNIKEIKKFKTIINQNNKYTFLDNYKNSTELYETNLLLDVVNTKTSTVIQTIEYNTGLIVSSTTTSDGKYIFTGDSNGVVRLYNVSNGKFIKDILNHKSSILEIHITHDDKYLISSSYDGDTKIWDVQAKKVVLDIANFDDGEWVAITPDGYFNASKNGAKHLTMLTKPMSITSIDDYYKKFYRPDIVKAMLDGKR